VEGACWFDDEQPHRLRYWELAPDPKKEDCGGLLKKLACKLNSPCGGFVASIATTALGAVPVKATMVAGTLGSGFQAGFSAGVGDDLGTYFNTLSTVGDVASFVPGVGTGASLAFSAPAVAYSGFNCVKSLL
jgi:hypothetical protein